jgi:hypothetical protein
MKDELFDDELRSMVNFTDETTGAQKPVEAKKNFADKEHVKRKKIAQKPSSEPMDAEYEPIKTWYDEKTMNMVKWVVLFMSLEYLFFYWQQTGQMEESAAMPSMIVCALLAGISVGKNWKWRN